MKINFLEPQKLAPIIDRLSDEEAEEARFYLSQLEEMKDTAEEILAAITHGCLLFRNYSSETGYYFQSPLPLSCDCDVAAAFRDIAVYCKLEAIPECIVGIPKEDLDLALTAVKYKELYDEGEGTFFLKVLTECMLTEQLPELMYEDIYLGEFALSYAGEYEKLVTDKHLNRFFGYNLTEDVKSGRGEDFILEVRREFDASEAMTFAVTLLSDNMENVFIGEASLYAFDGRGGASAAFRILPEWQGRGYGRKALMALLEVAKSISLERVYAEVMTENAASLVLLRSTYAAEQRLDGKSLFTFKLSE